MVTKNQIKLVVSLQQKKYRSQHGLFVAEGKKTVNELVDAGLKVFKLFVTAESKKLPAVDLEIVTEQEMKQMSTQSTPSGILGVFHIPMAPDIIFKDWILALDAVRDPGNLGTIIRLCDWFGIEQLICSSDTVDCYNPKVLQATMGSISRVHIKYVDLIEFLSRSELPVYGAYMDGRKVYDADLPEGGILVMGNEANGISDAAARLIKNKIAIPQFGSQSTESLNVATATAILLNEIRRD